MACKIDKLVKSGRIKAENAEALKEYAKLAMMDKNDMLMTPEEADRLSSFKNEISIQQVASKLADGVYNIHSGIVVGLNAREVSFKGKPVYIEGLTIKGNQILATISFVQDKANKKYYNMDTSALKVDDTNVYNRLYGSEYDSAMDVDAEFETIVRKEQFYTKNKLNEVFDMLNEIDVIKTDPEHLEHLRTVMKMVGNPLSKVIPEMSVRLDKKADANRGVFKVKNGEGGIDIKVGVSPKKANNQMSAAETYVHELVHAAMEFAFEYSKERISPTINRLVAMHKQAMEVLTWEDLMPDTPMNPEIEKQIAQKRLEYIKNSKNNLKEFLVYAVTNKKVIAKLKDLKVYVTKDKPEGFIAKLMYYVRKILDTAMQRWRKEDNSMMADQLAFKLLTEMMQVNNKSQIKLSEGIGEKLWDKLDQWEQTWEDWVDKLKDFSYFQLKSPYPEGESLLKKSRWMLSNWYQLLTNPDLQHVRETLVSVVGIRPESTLMRLASNLTDKDEYAERVDEMIAQAAKINRQMKKSEQTTKDLIGNAFNKPLTTAQSSALYTGLIHNDGGQLLPKYGKKVAELYSDPAKLKAEIAKLEKEVYDKAKNDGDRRYLEYQINGLVKYMQTGTGSLIQLKNAYGIAKRAGTVAAKVNIDKKDVEDIDTLVSLKLIDSMAEETKTTMAELLEVEYDGIEAMAKMNTGIKTYRNTMLSEFEKLNEKKGYVREAYDEYSSAVVAPIEDKKAMEAKGYKLVSEFNTEGVTNEIPMAIYVGNDLIRQDMNMSIVRYTGDRQQGKSITQAVSNFTTSVSRSRAKAAVSAMRLKATKMMNDVLAGVAVNEVNGLMPDINEAGAMIEFRYQLPLSVKLDDLQMETGGIEGVARSWMHEVDRNMSQEMNDLAFTEMVKDSLKPKKQEYVELSMSSDRAAVRSVMEVLPPSMKKKLDQLADQAAPRDENGLLTEEFVKNWFTPVEWDKLTTGQKTALIRETSRGTIRVRADMLYNIFGFRDVSLVNAKFIRMLPKLIKHYLRKMENLWKEFVSLFKIDVVIKTTNVIAGNIISNLMQGIQTGQMPWTIVQDNIKAAQSLLAYLKQEAEVERAKAIMIANNFAKKDVDYHNQQLAYLKANEVHPLMEAGLYQNVMEDITSFDYKSNNKITRWFDERLEWSPQIVRDGLDFLFVRERSSLFRFVERATAMSDFTARYTQYRHSMKVAQRKFSRDNGREPNMKEMSQIERGIIREISDSYINYSKPDTPFWQWMNDMGLVMFTKYAIRIQKVIRDGILKHPIRFALALLGQELLDVTVGINPDDIVEKSLFNKGLTDLLYMPNVTDMVDAVITPQMWDNYKDVEKVLS